jgi:hypothetical protein
MSGTRTPLRRTTRAAGVGISGALLAALVVPAPGATAGAAAAPDNDLIASATRVTSLPGVFTQDTTEATRSPDDGESVGGHSVWFRYRPAQTRRVRVTTIGSDYDTVLSLFEGPRGNRVLIKYSDDRVDVNAALQFRAVAGTRYWVAASAYGSGPAGELRIAVHRPGPLEATTTLHGARSGRVSGRLLLDGEIESVRPAAAYVWFEVSQRVGDNVARGYTEVTAMSPGWGTAEWTARLDSDTGWAFQPGPAVVTWGFEELDGFRSEGGPTTTTTVTVVDDPVARRPG